MTFPVYELDRRTARTRFIGGIQTGRRATDVVSVECVYVDSGAGHQVFVETARSPSREPEEMVARELYERVAPDAATERITSMSAQTLPVDQWSLECTVFGSPRVWGAVGVVPWGGELRVASVGLALEEVVLRAADLSAYRSD